MTLRTLVITALLGSALAAALAQPRTIEILADKDSRYKIDGRANPTITLVAGEEVRLVITARRAKTANRNGAVHGFALMRAKDDVKVPDWDLELKPGVQEFVVRAPEAGEYRVVCTVICSSGHEDMQMKVIVRN